MALREKGIPFETREAFNHGLLSQDSNSTLGKANPRLEVPVLVDPEENDFAIFDSTVILEYIEDKYPNPPLLPRSPVDRARARMIEDQVDGQYEVS